MSICVINPSNQQTFECRVHSGKLTLISTKMAMTRCEIYMNQKLRATTNNTKNLLFGLQITLKVADRKILWQCILKYEVSVSVNCAY